MRHLGYWCIADANIYTPTRRYDVYKWAGVGASGRRRLKRFSGSHLCVRYPRLRSYADAKGGTG